MTPKTNRQGGDMHVHPHVHACGYMYTRKKKSLRFLLKTFAFCILKKTFVKLDFSLRFILFYFINLTTFWSHWDWGLRRQLPSSLIRTRLFIFSSRQTLYHCTIPASPPLPLHYPSEPNSLSLSYPSEPSSLPARWCKGRVSALSAKKIAPYTRVWLMLLPTVNQSNKIWPS